MIKGDRLLNSSEDGEVHVRDRIVILEQEGHLAEVLDVEDVDAIRVLAPGYSVPLHDLATYNSPAGRVFVLHAPKTYISETRHLAEVEMATVMRHAIQYERVRPETTNTKGVWLVVGAVVLVISLVAVLF